MVGELVERLRQVIAQDYSRTYNCPHGSYILEKAGDRIEALEHELAEAKEELARQRERFAAKVRQVCSKEDEPGCETCLQATERQLLAALEGENNPQCEAVALAVVERVKEQADG